MRIFRALIISLLIHFALVWLSQFVPNFTAAKKNENVEIAIVNSTPQNKETGPVIRKLNLPDVLKADKTKNKYDILAEDLVRVKEELRALRSGVTQNRGQKNQLAGEKVLKEKNILDGINIKNGANLNAIPFQDSGESTLGMQLPDGIKAGLFTAVNTDRYLYSSYYNRTEELVLPEWSPMFFYILQHPPNALATSIHRRFSGQFEIWSKPSGEIITVKMLKSFGIEEFDRSLLEAFRRVRMIPNPPKDKIGPDHIARVPLGAFIEVDPKVLGKR